MAFETLDDIISFLNKGEPPSPDAGMFGATVPLPLASICLLGVPWDVTTSFKPGTARAPDMIRLASHQLDLEDHKFGAIYEAGIAYEVASTFEQINESLRPKAEEVIEAVECGQTPSSGHLLEIDTWSKKLNDQVKQWVLDQVADKKKVGLVGGDHSVSFGALEAIGSFGSFGVLHIDAHHDLRQAYEGFTYSHASIFYNALEAIPSLKTLTSVGIRDFSNEESRRAQSAGKRVKTFYDEDLAAERFQGQTWDQQCTRIINTLPDKVYISLDIDGLDQVYAPNTGTPVPGGLSFQQLIHLCHRLADTSRQIVGFDLVEVGPEPWDANVAARILYKLCGLLKKSKPITSAP